MNAFVRMLAAGTLIGAAACGGSDVPDQDTAAETRADSIPAGDLMAPAGDSSRPTPPGLTPVAVDDAERHTADQPTTNVPAGPSRQPAAPAGGREPAPAAPRETAQQPESDEGAAVLRRAAAAYEDVTSMQASFVMHFNNPLLRQQTTSRGTLYQQRPDRIALRFTDPDGDIILSDGQNFYIYQPSIDARQATQTPAAPGGGGGVDLQAQFVGNPTERFRYTLEGRENVGDRPADVMMLVPRTRAEYRSLKVWFDTRDSLARRFEITEHNGSVRRFDLSGLRTNTAVPADVFRFTPPAGVRIVRVG